MDDFLGSKIELGDILVFSQAGNKKLIRGSVYGFTSNRVKVTVINDKGIEVAEEQRSPDRTVIYRKALK